jgi:hypothetical protein
VFKTYRKVDYTVYDWYLGAFGMYQWYGENPINRTVWQ